MTSFRAYAVTAPALSSARRAGLYGRVEARLRKMARLSAPCTHPLGTRRFRQYLFNIEGDKILRVLRLSEDEIRELEERSFKQRRLERRGLRDDND